MKIKINIPGYTAVLFDVVAQTNYPVPMTMPQDPRQIGGQPQIQIAIRDVFICKVADQVPKVSLSEKFFKQVIPIGKSEVLFAVPPEALLDIITSKAEIIPDTNIMGQAISAVFTNKDLK